METEKGGVAVVKEEGGFTNAQKDVLFCALPLYAERGQDETDQARYNRPGRAYVVDIPIDWARDRRA